MSSSAHVLLFDAARRPRRVRFTACVLLVYAAVMIWLGVDAALHYGLSPGDGGVLAPPGKRVLVAGAILLLGLAPLAGWWAYATCYVTRLELDEAASALVIRTLVPGRRRPRSVPLSEVEGSRAYRGRLQLHISVDAPWAALTVRGRLLPYVLDMQGQVLNAELWTRGLKHTPAP